MPLRLCVCCLVTSAEKLRVNSMFGMVTRILRVCPHLSVVLNCGLKRHSLPLYSLYLHLASTHEEGNVTPLQYSCLGNPMDGGAWYALVHGVAGGRAQLSHFTFAFHFHALEKEMATHSSILIWRIPGMEEPGGLPSMGSHRVGHN